MGGIACGAEQRAITTYGKQVVATYGAIALAKLTHRNTAALQCGTQGPKSFTIGIVDMSVEKSYLHGHYDVGQNAVMTVAGLTISML